MKIARPLVSIALYLKGSDLDPTIVSKTLGIEPSRSQKKGGYTHGSTKVIAKIGMWALEISSDSRPVEEMVEELIRKIGDSARPLNEIEGVAAASFEAADSGFG